MNILEKYLDGHITIKLFGLVITIYGFNAMHVAVNIATETKGYVCFHPTMWCFGKWWPWYLYISPNATPWAATLIIGPGHGKKAKLLAKIHRYKFGNELQSAETYTELRNAI